MSDNKSTVLANYFSIDVPIKEVKAIVTRRTHGVSEGAYASLNIASHVGDSDALVKKNREILRQTLGFTREPLWLNQTHSTHIDWIEDYQQSVSESSDACFTRLIAQPCVIQTADCLPILCADKNAKWVGVIHAGWRGLADNIIEKAMHLLQEKKVEMHDIMVWIGPSICADCFEIGEEVKRAIGGSEEYYREVKSGKYLANLALLAKQRFENMGVHRCNLSDWCSSEQQQDFYSYRKEGVTGRTASIIWIE